MFVPIFRNLPRSLLGAISIITVTFVLTNLSYITVLGMDTLSESKVVLLVSTCIVVGEFTAETMPRTIGSLLIHNSLIKL